MASAKQIKESLTDSQLFKLLEHLGAEPTDLGDSIECVTICHHGTKRKLYYYKESHNFACYTGTCGTMDLFSLVGNSLGLDFRESFRYVCSYFGLSTYTHFEETPEDLSTSFFSKFLPQKVDGNVPEIEEIYMNRYLPLYHESWLNDGISIESMKKFEIRFSILDNQIIIPHRSEDGSLVGIRARNLNKEVVESGKKYMPVYAAGRALKHPTGSLLYGLDKTREQIEKNRTIILFESEKSVLQLDTMWPNMSIGVALSGSSFRNPQKEILKALDIDEVIIALDKEFLEVGDDDEKYYSEKITKSFIDPLSPYFRVSVVWDTEGLLDLKDSPTDKGKEVFEELIRNRIQL